VKTQGDLITEQNEAFDIVEDMMVEKEKEFFARDFYEDARLGKVPWPKK
jgi:hypothetical protein